MRAMPRHLMEHPEDVAIVGLAPDAVLDWEWSGGPFSTLTRTSTETSLVCLADRVPEGLRTEGPFRVVEVAGPLAFEAIGVFAEILDPLAAAGISVLGFSTFDTDWFLIRKERMAEAAATWRQAGLVLTPTSLTAGPGS